LNQTNTAGT